MMGKKEKPIVLFHLQRRDGNALFLHPFDEPHVLLEIDDHTVIEGRYGNEPDMEKIGRLRRELHELITAGVMEWIKEHRFPHRFMWTIGIFLGSYGLFSLVSSGLLPVTLPVQDGLIFSLVPSLFFYYLFRHKDFSSALAKEKQDYLKERIDSCTFHPDPFVVHVEELLHCYESGDYQALLQVLSEPAAPSLYAGGDASGSSGSISGAGVSTQAYHTGEVLLGYLKKRYSRRAYRRQEKFFSRFSVTEPPVTRNRAEVGTSGGKLRKTWKVSIRDWLI